MNIAFYIDEMNFRGVANSTYQYSHFNELILKNSSIIFSLNIINVAMKTRIRFLLKKALKRMDK